MNSTTLVSALCLAVVTAACAHRDAWKHKTLAGPAADRQFDADDQECEAASPPALSGGVYADHHGLATYESQNGSTLAGDTAGTTARRYEGLTSAPSAAAGDAAQAKTAASRVEHGVRLSTYERCMVVKGWSKRKPGDQEPGASASASASRSAEPAP